MLAKIFEVLMKTNMNIELERVFVTHPLYKRGREGVLDNRNIKSNLLFDDKFRRSFNETHKHDFCL